MGRKQANSALRTVNIKGKEYVEVAERVAAFWELFPEGSITTEIVYNDWTVCAIKATVSDGTASATGHAFEERKGMINTTSFIENCETSAVGRALGLFGIGSSAAIASADEVKSAVSSQGGIKVDALEAAKERLVNAEKRYAIASGRDFMDVHNETITAHDYAQTSEHLNRRAEQLERLAREGVKP